MDWTALWNNVQQNAIGIEFGREVQPNGSKFGGQPWVPAGFVWPRYTGTDWSDQTADRPLAFLMQIDLTETASYDLDHRLPDHGMLYFFYEVCTMPWGYDPADCGCARVIYVENPVGCDLAPFPDDLSADYRFPERGLCWSCQQMIPDYAEAFDLQASQSDGSSITFDIYEKARTRMGLPLTEYPEAHSHLLGYADLIQNEMCTQCELVQRGYYLGKGWPELDADEQAQLEKDRTEWTLLLQLGTVPYGKKDEWLWGDCGCIYFYIRKSDLAARRFDRVWLILQCG